MRDAYEYMNEILKICRTTNYRSEEFVGKLIYVMCLRKMIEDKAYHEERAPKIIELSRAIYHPVSVDDIGVIVEAYPILEDAYGLMDGTFDGLFYEWNPNKSMFNEPFLKMLAITSQIVTDEKGFIPFVYALFEANLSDGGRMVWMRLSNGTTIDLLSLFADVDDNEVVLDGVVGFGYSLLKCVEGRAGCDIYGTDINIRAVQVATMCMIIGGMVLADIILTDFNNYMCEMKVDKVIMDIPLEMARRSANIDLENIPLEERMQDSAGYINEDLSKARSIKWLGTDNSKETECLLIASALEQMEDNGRMVVIAPNRILYRNTPPLKHFREKIIREGLLKAVITLPNIYSGNGPVSSLLILEKGNSEVLFADATPLMPKTRREGVTFSKENQLKLKDIVKNNKTVGGISFAVANDDVLAVGDWSMSKYQRKAKKAEYRTVEMIDGELEECYEELDSLIMDGKEIL